eukprot:TRINITY_DN89_c0_g1_i6.p1 TRINITY_DN89_c0_g1~~TRINITY_DN89_c0_g1_i6.p1  ORF type:complete len:411 (+),score=-21.84 TRINITY_DN89_c0_g1_i6:75-1307(+)
MASSAVEITVESRPDNIDLDSYRQAQRANGGACVLGFGTATPPYVYEQSTYPDFFFRVTRSEHLTKLKAKFQRVCDRTQIKKRYLALTEELLNKYPSVGSYDKPSLDARQELMVPLVPELGKLAAEKAIAEWGQPKSKITHLIFCSSLGGVQMPGADYVLIKLMGLNPSVKRVMLWYEGCMGGAAVLRIAKDLAENQRGARVLIVCSELTIETFRGPKPDGGHLDNLAAQALFGDGCAAIIVGSDPVPRVERPWFQILWTAETVLPDSEGLVEGRLYERGLSAHLLEKVPECLSSNIGEALNEAFEQFGISDWNKLFWIAHPGGPAILDAIEATLKLHPKKLRATREVLKEYGNMSSATVLFIMDEMRRWCVENGSATTGEGLDYGVLFGFGPGLTVGTVALRAFPINRE